MPISVTMHTPPAPATTISVTGLTIADYCTLLWCISLGTKYSGDSLGKAAHAERLYCALPDIPNLPRTP